MERTRSDGGPLFAPPIAPHLHNSAVLRMLHEEEPSGKAATVGSWPPPGPEPPKPASFYTKVARGPGGRPFEWPPKQPAGQQQVEAPPPVPPRPANYPQANTMDTQQQQQVMQQQQQQQQVVMQQQHMQKVDYAPNQSTTYPSSFKMRDHAPTDSQQPARVVTSQPAFKITQPIKRSGDSKWPPKNAMEPTQDEVREFLKPRKGNKDYGEFFAQNALPNNWAGYRPPPGTQHHGLGETDM